jgi:serine protease inhibitor
MHARTLNALTASWVARSESPGVLSGAGLWPLLAVLAASADEPGRAELAEAVGLPADQCLDAAGDALKIIGDAEGVDAALGIWAQEAAQVRPDWLSGLPPGAVGQITGNPQVDQPRLDEWARERTRGLIERFPVQTHAELMVILATAVALHTTWKRKFTDETVTPAAGAWAGQQLAGLQRTTRALDDLRAATTPAGVLALTTVEGDNGIDVHLVLAEEGRASSAVLPAAMAVLAGDHPATRGSDLLSADASGVPGLSIVAAQRPGLALTTMRFTVRSEHDLLEHAEVFGLQTVSRADRGHFSRISPVPLSVDQAVQSTVATFSATGFEAAAVTAVGLRLVSMPVHNQRGLQMTYDRPFGFLAVHRGTGLVLFAGWVDEAQAAGRT